MLKNRNYTNRMSDNTSNYIEETTPLFRLLRTEAFRFIIVRYNHYSLVNQLKEDLKQLFPDRPDFTVDGRKTDYRTLVDSYYKAAKGFFYIEYFDEILANPQIYTGLNQRRDKLASYPIALFVFVSSSTDELFARQIMEKMPDLWSFRSLLMDLKVERFSTVQSDNWNQNFLSEQINSTTTTTTLGGNTKEEKEQELNRLLNRISEIPENELNLMEIVYQQIAEIYKDLWKYDNSIEYYLKLEKLQIETGDKVGEGRTLNNISQLYHFKGDYDTALDFLKRSLTIRQEIGDNRGEGDTLNNISQIFKVKGDYVTAMKYLKRSLTIRQEIGDKKGEGTTLNNISQIYKVLGDYDTALEYLKRSLTISQEIGYKLGEGRTLNNISQIYHARGDYDTALEYLKRSLKIFQEIGNKHGEGVTLNNISQIYHVRGDYGTALEYLKRSLTIRMEIGDKPGLVSSYYNMGKTFIKNGDKKQGKDYIILAGYMATNLGMKGDLSKMAKGLDPLIKEMGEEKLMEEGKRIYEQIVINSTIGQD